ncbi:hypothetical protein SBDP2_1580015 [Syntrophobacter sp. SbD2]|nr:hypothetical protein SBDP2_1580015 [Syntrophobacter sp. SbD2]
MIKQLVIVSLQSDANSLIRHHLPSYQIDNRSQAPVALLQI